MPRSIPPRFSLVALLLLCGLLFFWQLDAYSLFNETEAKQAEIARQIWVQQDWLTPHYNGEIYVDKPILLHWLMALSMPLVGLNEWAIRLPSAIAATGLILGTWGYIRYFAGERVGLLTATCLAANPFTLALGRTGQHDMLLTGWFSLALYGWFLGYATGRRWGYLSFWGAIALATLTKGPLALVLSGLILLIFLAWVGRWHILRHIPWGWGGLLFGAILLPWYGMMVAVNGWEYLFQFLGYNNVDRFLQPNLNQSAPAYFYLGLLAIGFFPWHGVLAGVAVERLRWRWLRPGYWQHQPPHRQLILFMAIWVVVVVGFMSMAATKLPWYVYPGLPPLAYLCAAAWNTYFCRPHQTLAIPLAGIAILFLLGAVLLRGIPRWFPDLLVIQAIQSTGVLSFWAAIAVITSGIIGLSAVYRRASWSFASSVVAFVLFALTLIDPVMPILDHTVLAAKLQPLVEVLQQEVQGEPPTTLPIAVGIKDPSLNFYSRVNHIARVEMPSDLAPFCTLAANLLLIIKQTTWQESGVNLASRTPVAIADDYQAFVLSPETCQSLSHEADSTTRP